MKTKILVCLILACTLALSLIGVSAVGQVGPDPNAPPVMDPNDPNTYQLVKVRLLSSDEELALEVIDMTLEQVISPVLDHELRRLKAVAKRKLVRTMTVAELKAAKEGKPTK